MWIFAGGLRRHDAHAETHVDNVIPHTGVGSFTASLHNSNGKHLHCLQTKILWQSNTGKAVALNQPPCTP